MPFNTHTRTYNRSTFAIVMRHFRKLHVITIARERKITRTQADMWTEEGEEEKIVVVKKVVIYEKLKEKERNCQGVARIKIAMNLMLNMTDEKGRFSQ
jgi:hypothetical protein